MVFSFLLSASNGQVGVIHVQAWWGPCLRALCRSGPTQFPGAGFGGRPSPGRIFQFLPAAHSGGIMNKAAVRASMRQNQGLMAGLS